MNQLETGYVSKGKKIIEEGPGFASGMEDLFKYININTVTAGIISTIFGCTGPALIVMNAADSGNLTALQTVSWLFGIYFFGGLIGVIMSLYYKMPICVSLHFTTCRGFIYGVDFVARLFHSFQICSLAFKIGVNFLMIIAISCPIFIW
jgi:hypothetical protein